MRGGEATMQTRTVGAGRRASAVWALPVYGTAGMALLLAAWVISWGQVRPLAQFTFFPTWLGYILLIDSIVLARRGTSLLAHGLLPFIRLFLLSSVFWWGFELLNRPVQNWHYLGAEGYTPLAFFLASSLAFSTVLPAVLETATLVASLNRPEAYMRLDRPPIPMRRLQLVVAIGLITFAATFIWPHQAYGFLWVSGLLVIEPIIWISGRSSSFRRIAAGDYTLMATLFAAGIICGMLWEMWNYYALPKWYYVLPGINAPKFFEMPLPGLLGYFPFALELYAMYNLSLLIFGGYSLFEAVIQHPGATAAAAGR